MSRIFNLRFWLAATTLLFVPAMLSAQQASRVVGRIIAVKVVGTVTVTDMRDPMRPHKLVERGEVTMSQIINTGDDSRVLLVFSNGATVNLGPRSRLSIQEFLQDPLAQPVKVSELVDEPTTSTTKLNLIRGEMISNVKHLRREKGSTFAVETPVGAAGIRGTTFQIVYRPTGNVANYALRMVEGKIAQDFNGRAREVEVVRDQQVALEGIQLDPTGRVLTLPTNIRVSDIPESLKASLATAAQTLLDAGASVNFPATKTSENPQQAFPQSGGSTNDGGASPDSTSRNGSTSYSPLSPVPPALPPAPRTTPGDGRI